MRFVRVSVPATTANLGPGFDTLGMALSLRNELEVEVTGSSIDVEVGGEGAGDLPTGPGHLVVQALEAAFRSQGRSLPPLRIRQVNRIPLARGLGSSAAAIVAGLVAARELLEVDLDLLALATRMEGHPDNVAPALLGGLTASATLEGGVKSCRLPLHGAWKVAVAVPEFRVSTRDARQVLPERVSLEDAVFNLGRLGVLLALLGQGASDLQGATEDRLHQPYRTHLIPGYPAVRRAALDSGAAGVFVSGSGPTIAALVDSRHAPVEKVAAAMASAFGGQARG
ncbi:MAG: homoserine kinase, partial [Candidatus Eremiobacterota bacterium]